MRGEKERGKIEQQRIQNRGFVMGKKQRIRAIAICLLRHNDQILVSEGVDSAKGDLFCRPLGGGVDFGETSQAAVIREMREELGVEITDVTQLGIFESIFEYEGRLHHEIVFVYDARLVDSALYDRGELEAIEGEERFMARWRSLDELRSGKPRLVPEALWTLL